jgi:hypothetical protein
MCRLHFLYINFSPALRDGGSHIDVIEDCTLLGCDAVSLSSYFPMFRKIMVFSAMEAQMSFETAGNTLPRTQDQIPEDLNRILGIGMPTDASLDFFTSLHAATMT